jgi:hypothetical protein
MSSLRIRLGLHPCGSSELGLPSHENARLPRELIGTTTPPNRLSTFAPLHPSHPHPPIPLDKSRTIAEILAHPIVSPRLWLLAHFFLQLLVEEKATGRMMLARREKKLPPPPAHHLNFSVFRSLQYISISKNFLAFYTQLISFLSQKSTNLLPTTRNNNHGCQRRSLSQDRCHCR